MNSGLNMGQDLALLLPQIAVVLTGVAALIADMVRRPRQSAIFTVIGLLLATALAINLLGTNTTVFRGTYRIDALSIWAVLILAPTTALCILLAIPEVHGSDREGTVYSLLAFTTAGALALAGAGDLMFLILGVLLSSLGSFALVAYPRDERATEAAMKYFVFGSVTGAIMIYGLTFWFGATGSTLLISLSRLGHHRLAAIAGLVAVLVGLGYKAALAPFHFWAPDAYDGGPLSVAAYLSVVPKIGAIFALAQVARNLPAGPIDALFAIAVLSAISMFYGNLAALSQTNVVRLLAYSSISQAGYFLLGVVAVVRSNLGIESLVIFAAAYAAMNVGAFAIVARVGRDLSAFVGVGRTAPWTGGAMMVFLLSLVGVPPLAGFIGKLLLFGAAINAGFVWLAVVAILNTVLSLAVYLRIVIPLYQAPEGVAQMRQPIVFVWVVPLALTIGIGLAAQALVGRIM